MLFFRFGNFTFWGIRGNKYFCRANFNLGDDCLTW